MFLSKRQYNRLELCSFSFSAVISCYSGWDEQLTECADIIISNDGSQEEGEEVSLVQVLSEGIPDRTRGTPPLPQIGPRGTPLPTHMNDFTGGMPLLFTQEDVLVQNLLSFL